MMKTSFRDRLKESESYRIFKVMTKNRAALIGLVIFILLIIVAILAPIIAPYDPNAQNIPNRLAQPSSSHLLGTDEFGRDILSRIIWGTRISLIVGFSVVAISISIGIIVGAVSGYYGGRVDTFLMRITDVFLSFPGLILAIGIMVILGPSLTNLILTLGIISWPTATRVVRGQALSIRDADYIQASKAIGTSGIKIILEHIIPNTISPVIIVATLGMGFAILAEAGLSFLGLGVVPPTPSWGSMISEGRTYFLVSPNMMTFPGLAISITVLAFNVIGDGLRDALDPSLRI